MSKEEILEIVNSCKNGMYSRETVFKNKFPEDYDCILKMEFPLNFTFPQKLYHYLNNDYELNLGLCKCGKRCSFVNLKKGYLQFCSNTCKCFVKNANEKRKDTYLKKYGVDSMFKADSIKEKIKKTCLEKYGVEHPQTLKETKEKVKQTNLKKFGVEYPLQSNKIKSKLNDFFVKKYGVANPFMSDCVKEKIKETNNKRYGVDNPKQSTLIKKKGETTNIKKYGVKHPMQNKDVYGKAKETIYKKYGVDNVSKSETIKDKKRKTTYKNYGVFYSTQSEQVKEKTRKTNKEKYGVDWCCLRKESINYIKNSKTNILFGNKSKENNITFETEFPLNAYSYDFKVESILVEINPTITHNSYLNIFGGEPKEPDYHLIKSNTAKEHGFHCIHIWDWDDEDKIINMLKPKKTLYARNLDVKDVDIFTANNFLNRCHLQSTCKGQSVCLGLFLNNELVQLMTFGKPRYNKNYEWELLRLCSHFNYFIVGGSEKLFSHFVKTYNPKSVVSYCDLSKFGGYVYDKLGFAKKAIFKPSKHWYNKGKHITDNLLRQRGFDQLFGTNYGKGTSNEELMLKHGFLPVYDCGQVTYVWLYE